MFSYEVYVVNQCHRSINWAAAGEFQTLVCELLNAMAQGGALKAGYKFAWNVEQFNELLVKTAILSPESPQETPAKKTKKQLPPQTTLSAPLN